MVFLFLLLGVVAGIFLVRQDQNIAEKAATPTNPPTTGTNYTASQIATHNTSSNCWLIISNKVYNVSTYLVNHPGGVSVVTPFCGKEATQAFNTQGGRGSHSNTAKNLLTQYLVGNLTVVSATASPVPTKSPSPSPSPTPTPTTIASSGNVQCNGSCTTSSQCASGRVCYISSGTAGFCRASSCVNQTGCVCPTTQSSPTPTPTPLRTSTPVGQATASPTPSSTPTMTAVAQVQATARPIPETGTSWPTILGMGLGILVITGSIILAF